MAVWPTLKIAGQTHNLEHLEPFVFTLIPRGQDTTITLLVEFSCHCFTRNPLPQDAPINHLSKEFEHRVFDPLRYGLSINLPTIIKAIEHQPIHPTREGHLARVELADGFYYHIFFSFHALNQRRVRMLVRSAYPDTRRRHQKGKMAFSKAAMLVVQGKTIKFP